MTWTEREKIFSKEVLTVDDIMALYECDKQKAYAIIRKIRHGSADRLGEVGKCHVEDYIECFKIPRVDRYARNTKI